MCHTLASTARGVKPQGSIPVHPSSGENQMTIFARIIAGEIPCHRVYEDDHVIAFLDVAPLATGHTLVVPKEAKATMGELSDDSAAALGRVLPRICRAVCAATGTTEYNLLQNNGAQALQSVPHLHVHIIPFHPDRGFKVQWNAGSLGDEAETLAGKIAEAI